MFPMAVLQKVFQALEPCRRTFTNLKRYKKDNPLVCAFVAAYQRGEALPAGFEEKLMDHLMDRGVADLSLFKKCKLGLCGFDGLVRFPLFQEILWDQLDDFI